jgi:hypothetical protein
VRLKLGVTALAFIGAFVIAACDSPSGSNSVDSGTPIEIDIDLGTKTKTVTAPPPALPTYQQVTPTTKKLTTSAKPRATR